MHYYTYALQLNPSKTTFAKPYNSAQGFHPGFFWVAFIAVAYITLRVFIAVRKDTKPPTRGTKRRKDNAKRGL